METQAFTFAGSRFVPVATGFFGLGTGYFIWGGQALFGFPKTSPEVNRTMGMWGFWMPGFMQFITGVYLLIGLTWFNVFGNVTPLYIAGLAFTAYGIHWFAMAHRRYIDSSAEPDGWMAIAFLFISILGVDVFWRASDIPVMINLRLFDPDLRRGDSYSLVLVESWYPPRRSLAVCNRNLAYVLHVRRHGGLGTRCQSLGVG
jgi:hypothetical protein